MRLLIYMAVFLGLAAGVVALTADAASAQPAAPASPAETPASDPAQTHDAPPAKPAENPGLLNEIGKLIGDPSKLLPAIKSPRETLDDLNTGLKGATDRWPGVASSVRGRVACPVTANGAPDCQAAAAKLCQNKGYREGKSLDTDAARTCSAMSMLSGRKPGNEDCKTETYVTRAICR